MKKAIFTALFCLALATPAYAQTVSQDQTRASLIAAIVQLIQELTVQIAQLQAQITAQNTNQPQVVAAATITSQISILNSDITNNNPIFSVRIIYPNGTAFYGKVDFLSLTNPECKETILTGANGTASFDFSNYKTVCLKGSDQIKITPHDSSIAPQTVNITNTYSQSALIISKPLDLTDPKSAVKYDIQGVQDKLNNDVVGSAQWASDREELMSLERYLATLN